MQQRREYFLDVYPSIPVELERLEELANNLWYSWDRPTRVLFATLDQKLWQRTGNNPKRLLRRVNQDILSQAAKDPIFLARYKRALYAYDAYHEHRRQAQEVQPLGDNELIGYFCMEYGFHQSLPIYSGGLGILAGHHCKEASDMRLPFVAVGLLYRAGYFTQQLDADGNQIVTHLESEIENLPIAPALNRDGEEVRVEVTFPDRIVTARVWVALAGHVKVYLLDTDTEENNAEDRKITYQLYGGDRETRIRQELVLGIGGVKALRALDIAPTVWHMNEGHPAFQILERMREYTEQGAHHSAALEAVASNTVFTTHTPVPAGHDHFAAQTVSHYLHSMLAPLGMNENELLALGCEHEGSDFNMTNLAIHGSRHHNGVSRLHGAVSANICRQAWPQVPPEENPMGYVTNGVHVPTVLAEDWSDLFDRFVGSDWRHHQCDAEYWQRIDEIPDHLFWSVRQSIKSRMLASIRNLLQEQHMRNQMSEVMFDRMVRHINPDDPSVLTIGFARRFATYKRADLLFHDLGWLREILGNEDRPVVFLFAGKAHPADGPGQDMLRRVSEISKMREFVGKVLLVEGYDLGMARRLLAGVDVWLNNPIYTMEASGTSGMKAAVNGTINLSAPDGWWAEGFEGDNGWAIRPSPHGEDVAKRDMEDAQTLYTILQDEVIPRYYDQGKQGHSPDWVKTSKRSIATVLPGFNFSRTLGDYISQLYAPAAVAGQHLNGIDSANATVLASWKDKVRKAWSEVHLHRLDQPVSSLSFGDSIRIEASVNLNGLKPEDVLVEFLISRRHKQRESVVEGVVKPSESWYSTLRRASVGDEIPRIRGYFEADGTVPDSGEQRFFFDLKPEWCGHVNYQIRVFPHHESLSHPFEMGLMKWLCN